MDERVLVPWQETREGAPGDLAVDVYDGDSEPPGDLSDVVFFVLPYYRRQAPKLVPSMPRLRVLQTLNAGYDDLLPLLRPGVTLCNGRGLHDASTAEHALGLILASQRDFPRWRDAQREGRWDTEHTRSLTDSRVLIIGYGSIGAALDTRLRACEAEVVRVARRPRPAEDVHGIADLPRLLPSADIVVLIAPLTADTRGLIGSRELALLRDDALVVNVGRGPVLDTAALLAENGRVRAALDVTDPEPLPADHPLWHAPGVFITPHVAGGSASFYPRAKRLVAEQLRRFATGEPLANVVRTG
ncbi:2-hydroxyacid dehydrogenase [Allonocardiopsis opalescens]|uniref:Phosphoglycerate dehydrogenase-like enzyme n=1 Tax=Allonocardiopsis opalescens TaxID=1144618 RepID=A0A2T0PVC2_9ACTN|nr:2-hydroxyacid dehydrogenase [Allonocardiopsis opalescens]PRX95479.1 phosphoglycerate dehydrogenase-like enzyme [Allonocardiopsis opalescens]